jgi:hypothetical protein
MFERPLAQVDFLCLYFFSSNLFDDSFYTIHGPKSRGFSVTKACTLVHGQKPGRFLSCKMLYDGQICLITGERADHGNAFPSSPPLFSPSSFERLSLLSWNKNSFFYLTVFIMTFHLNSSFYRKTNIDSSFPLNVPMACLSCNKRLLSL